MKFAFYTSFPYLAIALIGYCVQLFGVIDLVPSDVLSSFLLVAALQRFERKEALTHVLGDALEPRAAINSKESHHSAGNESGAALFRRFLTFISQFALPRLQVLRA